MAAGIYYGITAFRALGNTRLDVVEQCLMPISRSIEQSAKRIESAEDSGIQDYLDAVIDDETFLIENLLGIAFVICQHYITFIISNVKRMHDMASRSSTSLTTTSENKKDILRFGEHIDGSEFTKVQLIDALANYFKHQDEWKGAWEKLKGKQKDTASILQSAGVKQFSTGQFRDGARTLGNETYSNFAPVLSVLKDWGDNVMADYLAELKDKGLG